MGVSKIIFFTRVSHESFIIDGLSRCLKILCTINLIRVIRMFKILTLEYVIIYGWLGWFTIYILNQNWLWPFSTILFCSVPTTINLIWVIRIYGWLWWFIIFILYPNWLWPFSRWSDFLACLEVWIFQIKSGLGSCIAPKAGLARHPVKGMCQHLWFLDLCLRVF